MSENNFEKEQNLSFTLFKKQLSFYLRKWPYVLACIILFTILARVYLRYQTPLYQANSTVLINADDKRSGGSINFSEQFDLTGMMSKSKLEDEIEIFKSITLLEKLILNLNLQTSYYAVGKVISTDLYNTSPIKIKYQRPINMVLDSLKINSFTFLVSSTKGSDELTIQYNNEILKSENNKPIETPLGLVTFEKIHDFEGDIRIRLSHSKNLAKSIRGGLNLRIAGSGSKILNLSMVSTNKEKAKDILDELIEQYNLDAIEDKNKVLTNTATFIDDQLAIIAEDLSHVETEKLQYQVSQGLTSTGAEAGISIQEQSDVVRRIMETETQIHLLKNTANYLASSNMYDLLPSDVGISESSLNNQLNNYNNLVLEYNRLSVSSTKENPILSQLESQLSSLKNTLQASFQATINSYQIKKQELQKQANRVSSKIASSPRQDMLIRGIVREQELKEQLYIFLLQKRTEIGISLALSTPIAKVINYADASNNPISPKSTNYYLAAFALGVALPIGFFFVKNFLDNKVRTQEDLKSIVNNAIILGEIPYVKDSNELHIEKNDRSVLAEAFRIVNTNLRYLLANTQKESSQVIFITSTIAKEGKTTTCANIAQTISYSNKKTVVIGADLRNPQLKKHFDSNTQYGLSDYLFNDNISIDEIISKSPDNPYLDVIHTGHIPPNPAELLMRDRWKQLIETLKESYDFVIADTAPVLLVTDTFVISDTADLFIYVVRSGFIEQSILKFAADSIRDGKITKAGFVLNDVKTAHFSYGNRYGYGYGVNKETSFFKRLFNRP